MVAKSSSPTTIDRPLLQRAIAALLKHHSSTTSSAHQLLDNDVDIQVQFTLARIPGHPSVKPMRIAIPHPLHFNTDDNDDSDNNNMEAQICLIVKDESKPHIQELISRFPKELSHIQKVLTLSSLRHKHASFSQKRELLSRYDMFFADDRILPMLTKALGKIFFEKKKQPVPINICREEALPFAVQRALRATFLVLGGGTCVTVRAGNTSMSPTHLQSNIESICTQVPLKVPRKWANIKSISIKTTSSVALPIYNKTLEELELIRGMADVSGATNAVSGGGEKGKEMEEETMKKRKELMAKSPLARALKKSKSAAKEKAETDEVVEESGLIKTPKSSKKRKEKTEEKEENELAEESSSVKTPKSSKKRKEKAEEKEVENEQAESERSPIKTPKSSKKRKEKAEETELKSDKKIKSAKKVKPTNDKSNTNDTESAPFIPSKKYTGSKSGYVYRKDKQGLGYYRDVLPVVDKIWLAKLKSGKVGGGRGRKSMGAVSKKRRGNSRRSY